MKVRPSYASNGIALVLNYILAYILYAICRIIFVAENWNLYSDGIRDL
jgi:hypothetical protein